jgi:predicted nucleotidyltransferase
MLFLACMGFKFNILSTGCIVNFLYMHVYKMFMIEKLFVSRARVKILSLLLFSGKSFYINEIARLAGIAPIQAKNELQKLEEIGLLRKERKGKMILFTANANSPLYAPLRELFTRTEGIGNLLRQALKNENIKYAFIFGSFAKGAEKVASDVDLFVIGNVDEGKLIEKLVKVEDAVKREIVPVLWNEKYFSEQAKKGQPFLTDVSKERIIPIIGDINEFRRLVERRAYRKGAC